MRAGVGEVPCTWSVTPSAPDWERLLAICELLSVSRTKEPPVSELPAVHGALAANATTNASAGETSMACTVAVYFPAGPPRVPPPRGGPLREAGSTPLGALLGGVMKLPPEAIAALILPPG